MQVYLYNTLHESQKQKYNITNKRWQRAITHQTRTATTITPTTVTEATLAKKTKK